MSSQFLDRRHFVESAARFGVASVVFPSVLYAMADDEKKITKSMIADAAAVAGLHFDDQQIDMMDDDLQNRLKAYQAIHDMHLANGVSPALVFDPVLPGKSYAQPKRPMRLGPVVARPPMAVENVAFYTVRQLGELIRTKRISSTDLTQMYIDRLKRYDPALHFLITLTEDRALAQAKEADRDLAAGRYRGPLHGLPWGAKDLLATKGYKTTWGAGGFENQMIDEDATVVQRLDRAGAVLVAKLTLGALAQGDVWYGGMTRNPWNTAQGSSGSSAGPASATAAGCVAFSIGSETLGSISSPSTRCGCTGLRPTFGRVPRTGAMALSWSMDKLGPICRAVEDCAVVLDAIHGPDGKDPSTLYDYAFNWDASLAPKALRIGYIEADFEHKPARPDEKPEQKAAREDNERFNDQALDIMRTKLGWKLIPVKMPDLPWQAMRPILTAEAAAAFDELTRSGRDKLLTAQAKYDWPNTFREARLTPAVEYINANRARTLGMQAMAGVFSNVDVIVAPTFSNQLLITNLTGHPALILPNGFRADNTPVSLTFLGDLFGEGKLLAVAKVYQDATPWHLKHPTDIEPKQAEKPPQ